MQHQEIDPASGCPGSVRPMPSRTRQGFVFRNRYKCRVCGHRFSRYPDRWLVGNPLSPLELARIAEANGFPTTESP
jgi:hypothetical protein